MTTRTRRWLWISGALAVLAALAAAAAGPIMSNVEQPKYDVVSTDGAMEIRSYAPMIVAEATTTGARREAINEGFRLIAGYIFGNNIARQKVEMTAPVLQEKSPEESSQKIAMTAPVIQEGAGGTTWKVRFVMPQNWTMATLPEPKDSRVTLHEIKPKRFAVLRFSGSTSDENLSAKTEELRAYVAAKGLATTGEPVLAFYNPPWTLPFLRRNEVMLELAG